MSSITLSMTSVSVQSLVYAITKDSLIVSYNTVLYISCYVKEFKRSRLTLTFRYHTVRKQR